MRHTPQLRSHARLIALSCATIGVAAVHPDVDAASVSSNPVQPAQPAPTSAAPEATLPPIVLEAHVGERTAEAEAALQPLLEELEKHGFAARPNTIDKALGRDAPRPGMLDEKLVPADIALEVDTGVALFEKGLFKEAEVALSSAVRHIKRNPSLVVLGSNDGLLVHAFVHLAMAQDKLKRTNDARDTMLDLRRLSSTPPDHREYGPRAEELYRSSPRPATARGGGQLTVTVTDPHALIFLDHRYRGLGRMALGDIAAGPHALLVQVPGAEGRQYEIGIRAGEATEFAIDWLTDSRLHITTGWTGIRYATDQERETEAEIADKLARRWARRSVIIVGPTRINGVAVLLGVAYPASGEPSGAFIPLNARPARIRELALFLIDGTVRDGVNVVPRSATTTRHTDVARVSAPRTQDSRRSFIAPFLTTTAGVAIVASGAAAYSTSNGELTSAGDDGKMPAVYIMLGGSAVLGGGAYLWARELRGSSMLAAGTLGAGVASLAAGTILYVTNQDAVPSEPPTVRSTATAGLAFGVAGLGLAGVGLWMLRRDDGAPSTAELSRPRRSEAWPVVAPVGASGAMVGYAGSF
jgi:hypothetical protein